MTQTSKYPIYGDESLMSKKAHGTCIAPIQTVIIKILKKL
jgi:hypothetical protein